MSGRANGRERLLLLYDGECNLCMNTVASLRSLRTTAELTMLPLQQADPSVLPAGMTREELLAQLHVVDSQGRVYRGAESVVRILRTVPSLQFLAWLYRVPGLRSAADLLYKWIAKHRYKLFGKSESCENGACRLPQPPKRKEPE